jgi:Family of unknown function (DUF6260)
MESAPVFAPDQFLTTNAAVSGLRALMAFQGDVLKLRNYQLQQRAQNPFAANASFLSYDQWKAIDTTVTMAAEQELSAAADLLAQPTYQMGLWQALVQYQSGGFMSPAEITMDPRTLVDRDRVALETQITPVPFIPKEFSLHLRETSVPGGMIETANAAAASRAVNESIESMVVNGAPQIVVNGTPLYGYRTHPYRIIGGDLGQAWDSANNIFAGIGEIVGALWEAKYRRNIIIYLHVNEMRVLMQTKEGVDVFLTTYDRVLRTFNSSGLAAIKVSDAVPAGEIIGVAVEPTNVDMAVAQLTRTMQWQERGGMVTDYLVFAVMAPRIKPRTSTAGVLQAGIAHFTVPS